MSFQTPQTCGELLQRQDRLSTLRQPYDLVTCGLIAVLYDLVHRDFMMLHPMSKPEQHGEGDWRGVKSPADTPLPAFDASPQHLLFGKAQQGKTAYLAKILGKHIVRLRVSRCESDFRRSSSF